MRSWPASWSVSVALYFSHIRCASHTLSTGNPVFRCDTLDGDSVDVAMTYGHGLVSYSRYSEWLTACQPLAPASRPSSCADLLTTIMSEIGIIDQQLKRKRTAVQPSLDPDDLYQDFCKGNASLDFITSVPENCDRCVCL